MPFNNGENVGPYRVTEQLGRGGMATVYKAYHANLDRYVALKVLHPAFLEDQNFLARFQREARLVAKLEHPNIVPIYDFAEHDGQPYLVMKYVEGETLKALINRGRLSVEQIWDVVDAVGSGLAYAHKQGILHRDIKPSNVIVADDGQIYLADFGLARIAEMGESTLSGDMIMGTPQYISPEQAMGVKDLDARTDIYSFAVILYEMVVGQVPFSSDTPFSIIHDHIYSPLPLPKTVNPSVPEEVERVLLKALAKERDDRYQSVPELVQAFKGAWDEAGVDMAEVTMTKPITEVAPKIAAAVAPAPMPATVPPTQAPAPTDTADPAETGASQTKPKKKFWRWIGIVLVVLFACFSGLVVLDILKGYSQNDAPLVAESVDPFSPEAAPLPDDERIAPEELEDLQAWAESEPENADAHLLLALGFFDNKNFKPAYTELQQALDLAGDNVDFYIYAGDGLAQRNAWQGAAIVYTRALDVLPESTPEYPQFFERFHEALYKASRMPEVFNAIPVDELKAVDEQMVRLAQARQTFYHKDEERGRELLDELLTFDPGMPEARLFKAEILIQDRNFKDARPMLEGLANDEYTPYWIYEVATQYLEKMP